MTSDLIELLSFIRDRDLGRGVILEDDDCDLILDYIAQLSNEVRRLGGYPG